MVIGKVAALLVPHAKPLPDQVAFVDLASMTVARRVDAPRRVSFRALTFDPVRRVLVLVGNRERDHQVVTAQLRVPAGEIGHMRVIRSSAAGDLRVNSVSVAASGGFAVVAYHGTNTTGADTFRLPAWVRCQDHDPRAGCLGAAHGEAVVVHGKTYATTGTPPAVAVFAGTREAARIALRPSAHVTALAVEANARVAWVPGACDAPRGIWRVDLTHRRATRYFGGLPTLRVPISPCGYTIALSMDSRWAITTETALPVPDADRSGAIWIFGLAPGNRKLIHVPIASDPLAATFIR